jgi:hypothetical protein
LTALDALLKNVYLPGIRQWFNQNRPLWERLEKITDKTQFDGRKFIFAAKDSNPQGIGARAEGDTLPTATASSIVNMELQMKHHYAVINLSAQVMKQAKSNRGAFARAVDLEVKGSRDELEQDLAQCSVYGDGSGELGIVSAYSGTTLTVKAQPTTVGEPGSRFLRKNMALDSWSAKTAGTQGASNKTVSAVPTATTATVPASAGFVANDYLFRTGSRGNVQMGLAGIVDDGTFVGTFQALSRTSNPLLKANVLSNSGTLRAWTPELMDSMFIESWNNGGGGWPTAAYSAIEIIQRAAAYLRVDRRAEMTEMDLDNGFKALAWTTPDGKKPWIADQFVRKNTVYGVKEDDLFQAILEDFNWEDTDGSMWFRDPSRTHAFEAWLYTWRNIGCYQANNCTVLKDISHTA